MQALIHKRKLKRFPLIIVLFLLLSIPLGVYGLVSLNNFDTSSDASNQDQAVNSCFISFPYVNPESVEVDKSVQVQISAYVPGERISQINIIDSSGNPIFDKKYTQATDRVIDIFVFSPKATGSYNFMGTVTTDKVSRPCVVQSSKGVSVVATNTAPQFQTLPKSAIPSNAIKVGDDYQYTLKITDAESDTVNYAFSFTPDTNWLKYTVLDDGGNGKLTIKFTGKPDKPASYLANIFVHDGYINHLVSQSWVISVNQDKNDIPKVTVYEPATAQDVKRGDILKISWNATDLNKITKYDLYYATNPGNSATWTPIAKGLSVKVGHYLLDTSKLALGKYTFIVKATDNFDPPASGIGVSPIINITDKTPHNGPDDGPQLVDPQIINISPTNNSQIKNKRASISATLIAGSEASLKQDTIKVLLDDKDITSKIAVNQISAAEYTIVYSPQEDYSLGVHKVNITFEDSKGGKGNKEWNFELITDTTNNDNINIFGWSIPKRTLYIIAGGIGLLLLALLIPWLLYLAWRGSKDQDDYDYTNVYHHTKPLEPDTTSNNESNISQYSNITPRPIIPVQPVEENTIINNSTVEEMEEDKEIEEEKAKPTSEQSSDIYVTKELEPIQIFNTITPETKAESASNTTEPEENTKTERTNKLNEIEANKTTEPPITNVNINITQPTPVAQTPYQQPIDVVATPVTTTEPKHTELIKQPSTSILTSEEEDLPAVISGNDEEDEVMDADDDHNYEELLRLADQLSMQEAEEEKTKTMETDKTGSGENVITAPSPLPDDAPPVITPSSGLIPNEPPKDNDQQTQ